MRSGASAAPIPTELEPEHLDDAEHARQYVVGHGALDECQPRDVDERSSRARGRRRGASARPALGQSPTATSGSPQSTTPNMNAGLSRRAPVSESASTAPTKRPDPDRGVEVAHASVPRSSSSIAVTTMKHLHVPATASAR